MRAVCVIGRKAGVDNALEQEKLEARKLLKMATNPNCPVHALLGVFGLCKTRRQKKDIFSNLTRFYAILFFNR
jgi:hypothetical protein